MQRNRIIIKKRETKCNIILNKQILQNHGKKCDICYNNIVDAPIRIQELSLKECYINFLGIKICIKTNKKSKDKDDPHSNEKSSRKK